MKKKNVDQVVESILQGEDIKSVLGEGATLNEGKVTGAAVLKVFKALKPEFDADDLDKAIKKAGLGSVADELTEILVDIDDDGSLSDALGNEKEMKAIANSIAKDYFEGKDESGDQVNEAAGVSADVVVKAIKKLKPGFTGPALEKALKSAVKDAGTVEALADYFMEIEEEDELVSAFLSGDVTEKELKAAVKSFIDDVLNEDADEQGTAVNEGSEQLAKKVAQELKKLEPGEFTGDDLESALKKAGVRGGQLEELYDFLADIEEEEASVSQLASGDLTVGDFAELVLSFLED